MELDPTLLLLDVAISTSLPDVGQLRLGAWQDEDDAHAKLRDLAQRLGMSVENGPRLEELSGAELHLPPGCRIRHTTVGHAHVFALPRARFRAHAPQLLGSVALIGGGFAVNERHPSCLTIEGSEDSFDLGHDLQPEELRWLAEAVERWVGVEAPD